MTSQARHDIIGGRHPIGRPYRKATKKWLRMILCAAATAAAQVVGETWYWNPGTAVGGDWGNVARWFNASGAAATVAPTNGEDVVLAPFTLVKNAEAGVTIATGAWSGSGTGVYLSGTACSPTVGTLSGSHHYLINHTDHAAYTIPKARRFTVSDAHAFKGYFTSGAAKAYLTLAATPENPVSFPNVGVKSRLYVEVPDAATTGTVETVYQNGMLHKVGNGELVVGATRGAGVDVCVAAGGVTLAGEEGGLEARLAAVLDTAAVHLDASRMDMLDRYAGDDSRTYVSRWNDVRGNGFFAATNNHSSASSTRLPYCHAPFISPDRSPTGLPFVDFGTQNYTASSLGEIYGPTNCFLAFSRAITNVREAFYVVETPRGAARCTVLGSTSDAHYDFVCETSTLFTRYANNSCTNVWGGDIAVNGDHVRIQDTSVAQYTNCYVVSVGTLGPAYVNALANDRNYRTTSGGSRLGEVLLFTNALSRADRMLVNKYLNAKWRTGERLYDVGALHVAGGGGLAVPEGRTAKARLVSAPSGFTKRGGGTLVLDSLYPKSARIDVEGGSVLFSPGAPAPASPSAPAEEPYLWLDATADGSFTEVTDDAYPGTRYVTAWKDRRADVDRSAVATVSGTDATVASAPNLPYRTEVGGLDAVSFTKDKAMMRFPTWGTDSKAYAGFLVVKGNTANGGYNLFGCSNMELMRSGKEIVSSTYANPISPAAKWTLNGEPADPWTLTESQSATLNQATKLFVIAFSSAIPLRFDGLAADRASGGTKGDSTVAEAIVYHRPLTERERIDTEAYLMNKWLGAAHPETAQAVQMGTLTFDDENDVVVGGDANVTVAAVSGGNGTLVKKGNGATVVASGGAPDAIVVESGTLSIPGVPFAATLEKEMLYHFDAMAAATLATESGTEVTNYLGAAVTNVVRWNDCRDTSSLYAYSAYPDVNKNYAVAHPTLQQVETRPGVTRPMIDFGVYRNSTSAAKKNSAEICLSQAFSNVYETFGIFADANGSVKQNILSTYNLTGTSYIRGYNGTGALFANASYAGGLFKDGLVSIDGEPARWDTVLTSGVHLLDLCPTNKTAVSSFANDRTYSAGGCCIGEEMAFSRALSEDERTYLQKTLLTKWFGETAYEYTNVYSAVSLGSGATLTLSATNVAIAVEVKTLSGGGTIDADRVIVHSFVPDALDGAGREPLAVTGTLEFAPDATVELSCVSTVALSSGTYRIASAETLEGAGNITLAHAFGKKFSVSLAVENGFLVAVLRPVGTMVILR